MYITAGVFLSVLHVRVLIKTQCCPDLRFFFWNKIATCKLWGVWYHSLMWVHSLRLKDNKSLTLHQNMCKWYQWKNLTGKKLLNVVPSIQFKVCHIYFQSHVSNAKHVWVILAVVCLKATVLLAGVKITSLKGHDCVVLPPVYDVLGQVFPKALFWLHFCLLFMLTTSVKMFLKHRFMPMILSLTAASAFGIVEWQLSDTVWNVLNATKTKLKLFSNALEDSSFSAQHCNLAVHSDWISVTVQISSYFNWWFNF